AGQISAFSSDVDGVVRTLNRDTISRLIEQTETTTAALNRAAGKLDEILVGFSGFAGSSDDAGEGGLVTELKGAAAALRTLAGNFNRRKAEIAQGLDRLSERDARELTALINETQRTLQTLGAVLKAIADNPRRLIEGAPPKFPESGGRR
ncbi:MAG: hypothetical protein LBR29_03205, partial [Methylobacteriaceae bacterium]|nr:hypothetical protein [Methylobacteriaceae bacterium]